MRSHGRITGSSGRLCLLLAGTLLCSTLAAAADETPPEKPRIREIRIEISNAYSQKQAEESSWARLTNRYHIPTRESVIRTEVLFAERDLLDEDLIEATERALRRHRFLNKAEVKVIHVDDETVDVEIRTRDVWSLVPGLNIKVGGGLTTLSGHLMELNLLGFGKKTFVEAIYESDFESKTGLVSPIRHRSSSMKPREAVGFGSAASIARRPAIVRRGWCIHRAKGASRRADSASTAARHSARASPAPSCDGSPTPDRGVCKADPRPRA